MRLTRQRSTEPRAPFVAGPTGQATAEAAGVPSASFGGLLLRSWIGRILVASLAVRLITMVLSGEDGPAGAVVVLDRLAAAGLALGLTLLLVRVGVVIKRRLLWRVRRRLILSYVFIGVVPVLLVVAFFLFAGLLMFFNVSSFLFRNGFDDVVNDAVVMAKTAAIEIQRTGAGDTRDVEVLERKVANAAGRYPGVSVVLVPIGGTPVDARTHTVAGVWRHANVPVALPGWLGVSDFGGLLVVEQQERSLGPELVVRAVGVPDGSTPSHAVIVDIPVDATVAAGLRAATGIELGPVGVVPIGSDDVRPVGGVGEGAEPIVRRRGADGESRYLFNWVTFFDYHDWDTGRTGRVSIATRVGIMDIYTRISAAQSRLGSVSLGDLFLLALAIIAALFLIIEIVALATGLALARSITRSVHALFLGTARVREGDFSHRIETQTRDQLGELADSFNAMTASVEDLLQQAAEKRRMEEELRIARDIQVSLLPGGRLEMPGIQVTAVCDPAREVGGDYYDFFPLSGGRLGVLIADVSGKGTSAALYMAELKGIFLSLSRLIDSPRDLLIEVNRTISANLDSRSFITMTYAVIDPGGRTVTYVRAGHTPLIRLPAAPEGASRAELLAPDGLVVGLSLPGIDAKFADLLEEARLPLASRDLFVLFTDGVTEAMNADSDLFGEGRLLALIEEHGHLTSEELRERILREVEVFVGDAERHDDMTMLLIRIGDLDAVERQHPPVAALGHET